MKTPGEYTEECRQRKRDKGLVPLRIPDRWMTQKHHDYLRVEILKLIKDHTSKPD